MAGEHIDLSHLEELCRGDRSRMERYIRAYLVSSPASIAQLTEQLNAGDADQLALVAHSLRPQATYMGAHGVLALLTSIEECARAKGTASCSAFVNELLALTERVNAELRAHLADRSA